MRSVVLTAAFLGIISLFSLGVYSGIIEIKKPQNLLGLIGNNSDGFKFVGSVDLEVNLENSSSIQNDNYLSENNKNNKKEISAPIKIKKSKESSQTVVKVISGAAIKSDNNISSSLAIASVATSTTFLLPLVLPVIITTSTIENSAPVQIQETQEENIKKTQEQNLSQTPQIIQEPAIEQSQTQNNTPSIQKNVFNNILISEIMAGVDGNSSYEFIEFFNPTANSIDLTGWSIKKRNSKGNEEPLISSNHFKGRIILSNRYFLLANEDGYGLTSSPQADVFWPKSYTLAYTNNAIVIYNANGELVEEVNWTEISKGQSIERESFSNNQFKTQLNPNPQNSNSGL